MALTIEEIPQLNINQLKRGFYLNEGRTGEGDFQRNDDPPLYLESDLRTSDKTLRVQYKILDSAKFMDYKIKICTVPTNIGNSLDYYFLCPVTNKRAKILYLCYQSNLFVHRDIYPERLYYPTQLTNTNFRNRERFDRNDKRLMEHFIKIKKQTYKGKNTLIQNTINQLLEKRRTLEILCIKQMERNFKNWLEEIN